MPTFPHLTLILGGARSGKSAFAESLATSTNRPRAYIATSQAFDTEMEAKIAKHRLDRGPDWQTIEAPLDIGVALAEVTAKSIVLIDCLTLWLSNQMHADADIDAEVANLLTSLSATQNPVICVSNEVGMGLVPDTPLGRHFRDFQGRLNRKVAENADLAVFVAAGLPLTLKGALPKGLA
ncbi:bifunctional adenosylcobinamide kinase/adenosylcobinamide-phosphate guanylyltransferase [Rhodobacterales bacterium 52_120_T64]|nr:bifunctional adenosylcobinamide kinase/adenosylcobinamide-phosphate guanylyltransferase [Rhodobacterales bacterium 52_120_T64]